MRVAILSDTHGRLVPDVFRHLEGVDQIVHAGDIGPPDLLPELRALAPVTAVWGNSDGLAMRAEVPEVARRVWEGHTIVILHGHQAGMPTPEAVAKMYPDAHLVVFGHTHEPVIERVGPVLAVNPGSCTAPRSGPHPTLVLADIDEQGIRTTLIELVP